jgi:hypothetical protein
MYIAWFYNTSCCKIFALEFFGPYSFGFLVRGFSEQSSALESDWTGRSFSWPSVSKEMGDRRKKTPLMMNCFCSMLFLIIASAFPALKDPSALFGLLWPGI